MLSFHDWNTSIRSNRNVLKIIESLESISVKMRSSIIFCFKLTIANHNGWRFIIYVMHDRMLFRSDFENSIVNKFEISWAVAPESLCSFSWIISRTGMNDRYLSKLFQSCPSIIGKEWWAELLILKQTFYLFFMCLFSRNSGTSNWNFWIFHDSWIQSSTLLLKSNHSNEELSIINMKSNLRER